MGTSSYFSLSDVSWDLLLWTDTCPQFNLLLNFGLGCQVLLIAKGPQALWLGACIGACPGRHSVMHQGKYPSWHSTHPLWDLLVCTLGQQVRGHRVRPVLSIPKERRKETRKIPVKEWLQLQSHVVPTWG